MTSLALSVISVTLERRGGACMQADMQATTDNDEEE